MSVFFGIRIPYDHTYGVDEAEPGPPVYPGNFNWENSNTPYLYPWGRKERNPWFIGPFNDNAKHVTTLRERLGEKA